MSGCRPRRDDWDPLATWCSRWRCGSAYVPPARREKPEPPPRELMEVAARAVAWAHTEWRPNRSERRMLKRAAAAR